MKRFRDFISVLLIALVMTALTAPLIAADAWTTGYNPATRDLDQGKLLLFQGTVDGAGNFTSGTFELQQYDGDAFIIPSTTGTFDINDSTAATFTIGGSSPLYGSFKCDQENDSSVANFILQGSDFPTDINAWAAIDTAAVADTSYGSFALSITHKYRAYRAVIKFTAATGFSAAWKFALYVYRPRDEQ